MGTCYFCGIEVDMSFRCSFCNLTFCSEHRIPEMHNCISLTEKTSEEWKKLKEIKGLQSTTSRKSMLERTENVKIGKEFSYKFLLVIILVAVIVSSTVGYFVGNSQGYRIGYDEGESFGYNRGYNLGFSEGRDNGQIEGYNLGYTNGTSYGWQRGYSEGNSSGYKTGFISGNLTGFNYGIEKGNATGFLSGYNLGFVIGFNTTGYNIRDPTYQEAIDFIYQDQTDKNTYVESDYVCHDFSYDVKRNAFNAGFHCLYVVIEFPNTGHAIVAFNTTDKGLLFIEPQWDKIVTVKLGIPYSTTNHFLKPSYDDTITKIELVP